MVDQYTGRDILHLDRLLGGKEGGKEGGREGGREGEIREEREGEGRAVV